MKIALLGYGKMGKEIEKIALERNHEIVLTIDVDNISDLTADNLKQADVAIDFSIPSSAYDNILTCFEADVPVVCGTTGWLDKFDTITELCNQDHKTFFYASNFSIGVNILFTLNRYLAHIMDRFNEYDVRMKEVHHIHKLDAPSGTAISLAQDVLSRIERKEKWELESTETSSKTLEISALREGEVPGIHHVIYESPVDTIQISHSAKNRKGLALGAVMAAEFIKNKTGVFNMSDLLSLD